MSENGVRMSGVGGGERNNIEELFKVYSRNENFPFQTSGLQKVHQRKKRREVIFSLSAAVTSSELHEKRN